MGCCWKMSNLSFLIQEKSAYIYLIIIMCGLVWMWDRKCQENKMLRNKIEYLLGKVGGIK